MDKGKTSINMHRGNNPNPLLQALVYGYSPRLQDLDPYPTHQPTHKKKAQARDIKTQPNTRHNIQTCRSKRKHGKKTHRHIDLSTNKKKGISQPKTARPTTSEIKHVIKQVDMLGKL